MNHLFRLVCGFFALKLTNLIVNMSKFPVVEQGNPSTRSAERDPEQPSVCLLVPMRNEQDRIEASLTGLLDQDVDRFIMLDDCSTDDGAALVQAMLAGHPRAQLLTGKPAPAGWAGKTWACHQLGEAAEEDILIFCDADVLLAPGALRAVVAQMRAENKQMFSVFPRQITRTLGEQLVIPLIDDVLLCFLPYPLLALDIPAAATANGSLLAFTRAGYQRLGGFAAVRHALIDDLELARLARRLKVPLGLALGGDLVQTRMYTSFAEIQTAFGRNLLPAVGGSRLALLTGLGWHLIAYTVPVMAARRRPRWLIVIAAAIAERLLVELKTGRRQWWLALMMPLTPPVLIPIVLRSLRRSHSWRGRTSRS